MLPGIRFAFMFCLKVSQAYGICFHEWIDKTLFSQNGAIQKVDKKRLKAQTGGKHQCESVRVDQTNTDRWVRLPVQSSPETIKKIWSHFLQLCSKMSEQIRSCFNDNEEMKITRKWRPAAGTGEQIQSDSLWTEMQVRMFKIKFYYCKII